MQCVLTFSSYCYAPALKLQPAIHRGSIYHKCSKLLICEATKAFMSGKKGCVLAVIEGSVQLGISRAAPGKAATRNEVRFL